MKEISFDIKNFSYTLNETGDVSFIPMLLRRKLNDFGRAAIFTLSNVYENKDVNLVFSSNYGDFERVEKLISQRRYDGDVSPAGFSSSVHNAVIGLFSLVNKIKSGYNSISAGDKSLFYGLVEGILNAREKDCIYCYTESFGGLKSCSVLISQKQDGEYILTSQGCVSTDDGFNDFIELLNGERDIFVCDLFAIRRRER